MSSGVKAGLGCIGLILLIPVSAVLYGLVLNILWGWFIVPFGLPTLSIWQALGISIVIRAITYTTTYHKDHETDVLKTCLAPFINSATFLVYGWLIHQALLAWG